MKVYAIDGMFSPLRDMMYTWNNMFSMVLYQKNIKNGWPWWFYPIRLQICSILQHQGMFIPLSWPDHPEKRKRGTTCRWLLSLSPLSPVPLVHQNELNPRKINNSFEASQILVWTSLTRGHHTVPVIARGLFQGFSLRFRQTCCRKRNPRRLRVGPQAAWLMNPLIKESNILSINNIPLWDPWSNRKNTCLGIATQNSILELHEN